MSIVVISGRARVGKDTLGSYLREIFKNDYNLNFAHMAYAGVLKDMAQKDFDLSDEQLWGDKKEEYDRRYRKQPEHYGGVRSDRDELPENYWTAREIMQAYGSFYRSIDSNFWVRKLFSVIEENDYKDVVITDGRYPNEILPVLERGGFHIRVNRKIKDEIHGPLHESETSLDNGTIHINFVVNNNGTFEELKEKAKTIASYVVSKKQSTEG